MKKMLCCLMLLVDSYYGYTQEEQLLLLNSRKVKEFVYLSVKDKDDKLNLEYKIDQLKHTKDFDKTLYISSRLNNDQVIVYTDFINPLKYTISFNDTTEADPSLQNLSTLLDAVATMATTLTPASSISTSHTAQQLIKDTDKRSAILGNVDMLKVFAEHNIIGDPRSDKSKSDLTKKMIEELLESKVPILADWKYNYISNADNLAAISLEHTLISSIKETSAIFYQDDNNEGNFSKSFTSKLSALTSSDDYAKFAQAKIEMQKFIDEWQGDKNFKNHKEAITTLKKNIESITKLEDNGNSFIHYTFVTLGNYLKEVESIQKQRENILTEAGKILKEIEKIEFVTKVSDDAYGMIKHKVDISDENIKIVTVTVKKRVLKFDIDKFNYVDGSSVSQKMKLRSHSNFIIEASAGIYYSNIKYPVFGTEEVGGVTKLKQADDDILRIIPATAVNLVFNGVNSWVHPMAQIGVGSGKDRPILLTGLGARFFKPRNVAMAIGLAWPWMKQLDKLKVGDTITGTADIENDTKYTLSKKPELYIGIQIDFK